MAWNKFYRSAILCGGLALAAAGCKSSGGGGSASRDPIFGSEKIPPPGVPVPGQYGAARKDPLLKGTATGRGDGEPYRQSAATTPAALAGGKPTAETDTLAFDRNKGKGEVVPVSATSATSGDAVEQIRSRGGRLYAAVRLPTGECEVRCAVPVGTGGAMRSYAAIGSTQAAAMRDLIAQVRADEKR